MKGSLVAVQYSGGSAISSLRDELLHAAMHVGPLRAEFFSLLFGVITRPHERPALADFETSIQRRFPKAGELIWVDPAIDGKVVASRLEVLADGDDVAIAPGADVIEKLQHLVLVFADSEHDAGLGDETVGLELLKHLQAPVVTGLRADRGVHAVHRLHVVADDLRPRVTDQLDIAFDALEIADQNFNAGLWRHLMNCLNRLGPDPRATVGLVVSVDTGDDHVLQLDLREDFGDPTRLVVIHWHRLPGFHVAESATPGAGVTEDHDRRRAAIPALTHVRTTRLLADGVKAVLVDERLQLQISLATRDLGSEPIRLAADPHLLSGGLIIEDHSGQRETRRPERRSSGITAKGAWMPGQRSADRGRTGDIGISRRAGGAGGDLGIRVGRGINTHSASLILASTWNESTS